jgi:hypothetical protein
VGQASFILNVPANGICEVSASIVAKFFSGNSIAQPTDRRLAGRAIQIFENTALLEGVSRRRLAGLRSFTAGWLPVCFVIAES